MTVYIRNICKRSRRLSRLRTAKPDCELTTIKSHPNGTDYKCKNLLNCIFHCKSGDVNTALSVSDMELGLFY